MTAFIFHLVSCRSGASVATLRALAAANAALGLGVCGLHFPQARGSHRPSFAIRTAAVENATLQFSFQTSFVTPVEKPLSGVVSEAEGILEDC
jgi:hypothetical protein